MGAFDRDFTGNVPIIKGREMMFEAQQHHMWGRWAKFNTPDKRAVNPNKGIKPETVSNAPVVIQREFQKNAGDLMYIPKLRLLTQNPTFGLDQMQDREERQKINHCPIPLDILRHAVEPQEGAMSTQTSKDYSLIDNARPGLLRHFSEALNYMGGSHAMYNGFSKNVLDSIRWTGNATVSAVSHPHIFVAGDGKVTYGVADYPGTSAYEAAIATAVGTLGAGDVFDTGFLDALAADETIRYIQPLYMKGGDAYRIIAAHPYQIYSLRQDSAFREVTSRADAQAYAKENPLLVGCKYFWGGWAIFDGSQSVFPVRDNGGVAQWGPATVTDLTSYRDYSGDTAFGAMVLGDNALLRAIGQTLQFKRREADYGELIGIAYRALEGWSRGDYRNLDDGVAGANWINDTSAIAMTYAAKPSL